MLREWTLEEHRRMMQLYERMPNNWRLISVVGVRRGSEGQTMGSGITPEDVETHYSYVLQTMSRL